jgi:hypothetical protein
VSFGRLYAFTTMTGLTLLEVRRGSVSELEGDQLETTLLKTTDDVADETSLDAVGLRWDEMRLLVSRSVSDGGQGGQTLTMIYVRS